VLVLGVTGLQIGETGPAQEPVEKTRHKGVCFVGGRRRPSDEAFDRLAGLGVDWISQTPFGLQRSPEDPLVVLRTSGRVWWGESDEGLIDAALRAREHGIRTMLKPHLWISDRSDGRWRGNIEFRTEAEWNTWWEGYRELVLHYAGLAAVHEMEAFCVGTELRSTVLAHAERWRSLIAEVRGIYTGELTYSANWYREFEEVPFWDMLDAIGIQAYFPLSDSASGEVTVASLQEAWEPHLARISAVQKRVGKPVIFTEVGYRSTVDATATPWTWRSDAPVALELQADAYESVFQVFWDRAWFGGVYIWKWYPVGSMRPSKRRLARRRRDFTPQGKPAEAVLARWFGGSATSVER
jgi:hypothetical protein